jgi:hypothetical protein
MNLKNGKLPLSTKTTAKADKSNNHQPDQLAIPEAVLQDMKAKGLTPKWLNAKVMAQSYGYHPKGFQVYRPDPSVYKPDPIFGGGSENVVRRGDLILGYLPNEIVRERKELISKKNTAAKNYEKNTANELRQMAREAGVNTKIEEGYDETE